MLSKDYRATPTESAGDGITIRWVVGSDDGAPNFALRVVEFEPGAVFPAHQHPYEHEIFVLEGQGAVYGPGGQEEMRPGTAVLVLPDEIHGYRNTGAGPLRFVCVIPHPD